MVTSAPTGLSKDPLIPKDSNNATVAAGSNSGLEDPVEQTLGGKTYSIDTSQLIIRRNEKFKKPLWKSILKSGAMILAIPVIIPTAALYVASMYFGPSWYRNKVIEATVSNVMKSVGELFDVERKELLEENIGPNDAILDLGAGSGNYLKFLSKGRRLVGIEPVANFHQGYKKAAIEAGLNESQVEMHACDIETYVQNYPQEKSSFDLVVLGNVLCEVSDQMTTLSCVHQLLKPGGHVYFSEHLGMPKGTFARRVQDFVNPLWRTAGGGCNCNRDSLLNIRRTPGWQVISWQYYGFKVGLGPWVLGLAMKDHAETSND
ncbi:Methyltransferase-like protein 7B [Seminavis robusta]|uniref:Methyltransferase-like protein 7B n=1 Tax=Seminavis robusta TaxID=568900 RepID=A0A9N8DYW5_9STRA|nr:Methyltransferase-like protein 7B [Seminavis robusta]|eukprot:Sro457_g146830.1 Methyltransferase-like protein 7B (318) ;mRNA; f:22273-23335